MVTVCGITMALLLVARMTRAILGHAPIGEYFARFNIDEPHGCSCDPAVLQTRDHLLYHCPRRQDWVPHDRRWLLPTLVKYLKLIPGPLRPKPVRV